MVRRRPTSADGLLELSGVGAAKLERYGARFLGLLREHADGLPATSGPAGDT
jgi:superfamily II DNA helicase RecQ